MVASFPAMAAKKDESAPEVPAAAIAMQVIRVLSVHGGPLAARVAYAMEKAHVFLQPRTDVSFVGLSDVETVAPETRAWLVALEASRTSVGGFWADYTNTLSPEALQKLAEQIFTNALQIAAGRPATALDAPPLPADRHWDGHSDGFAISAPSAAPLFQAPTWRSRDGGGSIRSLGFQLPLDKLERGRRLMRALQHQVRHCYEATALTESDPRSSDPGTEIVAIRVVGGLVLIQALSELFEKAYPRVIQHDPYSSPFVTHLESDTEGQVVSGLKLIRNAEVHDPTALLEFDTARMTTAFFDNGTQGFQCFPIWPAYGDLPQSVQDSAPRTAQRHHDNYENTVGERHVVDTLLDALKFFLDCDSRLARLARGGEPSELPLEAFPLPVGSAHGYERPHPYWPTVEAHNAEAIEGIRSRPPTGEGRIVVGLLFDDSGCCVALCGNTRKPHMWTTFTETPEQVVRDITEFEYEYLVEIAGERAALVVEEGELRVNGLSATEIGLSNVEEDRAWRSWFELTLEDATFYWRQRYSI